MTPKFTNAVTVGTIRPTRVRWVTRAMWIADSAESTASTRAMSSWPSMPMPDSQSNEMAMVAIAIRAPQRATGSPHRFFRDFMVLPPMCPPGRRGSGSGVGGVVGLVEDLLDVGGLVAHHHRRVRGACPRLAERDLDEAVVGVVPHCHLGGQQGAVA